MEDNKENVCSAAPSLIFACSGAADVGAIADRAARKLTADGAGKMYCLAGIGGRVAGILKTTEEAEKILPLSSKPHFLNFAIEVFHPNFSEERNEETYHHSTNTCFL